MFQEHVGDIFVTIYKVYFINYFLDLLWSQLFSHEHFIHKNGQIYLILFPYYLLNYSYTFFDNFLRLFINCRIPVLKNKELIDFLTFNQLSIKDLSHAFFKDILRILPFLFKRKTHFRNFKFILVLWVFVCQNKLL